MKTVVLKMKLVENNKEETDKHDTSFTELLKTPDQKITKNVFNTNDQKGPQPSTSGYQKKESWYCSLCEEDRMWDMRQCTNCNIWVHEECCGLTAKDKVPNFKCPSCE